MADSTTEDTWDDFMLEDKSVTPIPKTLEISAQGSTLPTTTERTVRSVLSSVPEIIALARNETLRLINNATSTPSDSSSSSDQGQGSPVSLATWIALVIITFLVVFVVYVLVRHRNYISIIIKTFPRDYRGISGFVRTFHKLKKYEKEGLLVADVFDKTVEKYPNKVLFVNETHNWTFKEVWSFSNRVANYFISEGYEKGDVIALFMENRPEYVGIWLGLSRVGIVTALINSNLKSDSLAHSIEIAGSTGIIFGQELGHVLQDLEDQDPGTLTKGTIRLFGLGQFKDWKGGNAPKLLLDAVALEPQLFKTTTDVPEITNRPKFHDGLLYIYTSGTTGMPKAAIVTTARYMMGSISFHCMNNLTSDDILYTCLPLYHTAGGLCGVGQGLYYGNTVVLRRKFSASQFWKDCVENRVTVAQYIGELCRYLLSQSYSPVERSHRIRVMIGNGLRPEIWREFVQRFNIRNISEIYGSTDGNCNFVNFDNRVGAVGFIPVWAAKVYPMGLIQVDEYTGQPVRDDVTGLVVRCKPNEAGELVGKIVRNHPIRDFQGYAGKDGEESTNKKILTDVFAKGDAYFRTGDFLVMDEYGYFYFKDRAGDTFRWKGENVATAEVEGAISKICGFQDSVVFGVKVPKTDGKAGMAVIADPNNSIDMEKFAESINKALAPYARPVFLRICDQIESTSTHKMKKFQLQQEAFDISKVSDPIYFYSYDHYVPLDASLYSEIINGRIRV